MHPCHARAGDGGSGDLTWRLGPVGERPADRGQPCRARAGVRGPSTRSEPRQARQRASRHHCRVRASGGSPNELDFARAGKGPGALERRLGAAATAAANFFPLWLVLAAAVALRRPALLAGLTKDTVTAGLAACMLAMGTTLTVEDFVAVSQRPGLVALGAALQYTIMPALGFAISRAARLPTPYAVGLCLVACCPGGVASNVVTFLACADVPLSVCEARQAQKSRRSRPSAQAA